MHVSFGMAKRKGRVNFKRAIPNRGPILTVLFNVFLVVCVHIFFVFALFTVIFAIDIQG